MNNSFLAKKRFLHVMQRVKLQFMVIHSIFYWVPQNNYEIKVGKLSVLIFLQSCRTSSTVLKLLLQKVKGLLQKDTKVVEFIFIHFFVYTYIKYKLKTTLCSKDKGPGPHAGVP